MLEAIQMSDVSAGKKAIKPIFELAEKGWERLKIGGGW